MAARHVWETGSLNSCFHDLPDSLNSLNSVKALLHLRKTPIIPNLELNNDLSILVNLQDIVKTVFCEVHHFPGKYMRQKNKSLICCSSEYEIVVLLTFHFLYSWQPPAAVTFHCKRPFSIEYVSYDIWPDVMQFPPVLLKLHKDCLWSCCCLEAATSKCTRTKPSTLVMNSGS